MDAQQATTSYDCKQPGCTNEASSPVGRYSYCREHQNRAARGQAPLAVVKTAAARGTTVADTIHSLAALAREVDKAHAKATKLTEQALAAKREADAKAAEFRAQARALIGNEAT